MSLHVERSGAGPDLVLLHGWGIHSGVWAAAVPQLAQRFRVHAVDLPGHGGSAGAPAGSFDECVGEVAQTIPAGAIVCGWSLGGLVAQALAQRCPAPRALLLVGATPCFVERDDWQAGMSGATFEAFADGVRSDPDAALDGFTRLAALNGVRSREAIRDLASCLGEAAPPSCASLLTALGWLRACDLRGDAPRIAVPVALVHGSRDAVVPAAAARWLAAALPHARLAEIADAGHVPFLTHRAAFLGELEALRG